MLATVSAAGAARHGDPTRGKWSPARGPAARCAATMPAPIPLASHDAVDSMPSASLLRRLLTTPYEPDPGFDDFTARAATQEAPLARVALAVLDAKQSRLRFGVEMVRRGVQPVWVRVENRAQEPLRLHVVGLDPNYYTPLEAAGLCRFSFTKRLTAFGAVGWLFLPLLALVPLKVVTA